MHNHLEEARILSINGRAVPAARRTRTDMFRLGRNTTLELFLRFRDFPDPGFVAPSRGEAGRYVMHCHNLSHEDDAMMVTWNLVP